MNVRLLPLVQQQMPVHDSGLRVGEACAVSQVTAEV
jgi:hypothetical protein